MARCELTHLARQPIDVELARRQHADYEALLAELGCEVERVAPAPELPDSVFVEDTAVVLDEIAVLTRPGAPSRRDEVEAVGAALARHRPLVEIFAPATLDGGDVLRVGRRVFVGLSARTDEAGIAQLTRHLAPHGYEVVGVPLDGCLHLKSAVTLVAPGVLLLNPSWVDGASLVGHERIEVDPGEPFAANALRVGETVVLAATFARTRARLEAAGIEVRTVDVSELAKAEGGVTCCSILLPPA
jgi:dimethylargininase